jgi:hypothetical protein
VARTINPETNLGALPSVLEGGDFDFAFSRPSLMCQIRSALLIAVRPSFSTIHCKTLNIFIKVCYSLPCTLAQSPDSDPVQKAIAPEPCAPFASRFPYRGSRVYPVYPELRVGAPMGYALFPSPSLASGPQVLLLSKFKAPINHVESTLLQVFFLKNLKPFEINTFEKQGEGCQLSLTNCSKKVSPPIFQSHFSAFCFSPSRAEKPVTATSLFPTLTNRDAHNSFRIRSYANDRGVGLLFPYWNSTSSVIPNPQARDLLFFSSLPARHSPLATFFINSFSTGAAMISRTRSRRAGTSSFVKFLVSMVSCR